MEGPCSGAAGYAVMTRASDYRSGKSHGNENFPVASLLIARRHRPLILAFYAFARTADDVSDHPGLSADKKLKLLDSLKQALLGQGDDQPEAVALRKALQDRNIDSIHALDLLEAFRRDVLKPRYRSWGELMDYCRYSAMPVGRFVLEAHGEDRALWPASDAICTALQVINHLQDCGADYRNLDRVYLPLDDLKSAGAEVGMLGGGRTPPELRRCLDAVLLRTAKLLDEGRPLPRQVKDFRLALELEVIIRLADHQLARLKTVDPLRERARLGPAATAAASAGGVLMALGYRLARRQNKTAPRVQTVLPVQSAAGSSFYTAMRVLPREQRKAMLNIYAFCRAVDDIADSGGARELRLDALDGWRRRISRLYRGADSDGLADLASSIAHYDLSEQDFLAVIDGMEMDVREDIRAPDMRKLDLYCDRVASAVGRLSVRVFGLKRQDGDGLAHHLGRALQLTNILRDLDEDAALGRLYLPREALRAAGIRTTDPFAVLAHPGLDKACLLLAARAYRHYDRAQDIMRRGPRHAVRAPRIMADVYRNVLDHLVARGWERRIKIRLPRARLATIVLRHAFL